MQEAMTQDQVDGNESEPVMTDGTVAGDEGEFELTVRKLDLPVRPRGVLAE